MHYCHTGGNHNLCMTCQGLDFLSDGIFYFLPTFPGLLFSFQDFISEMIVSVGTQSNVLHVVCTIRKHAGKCRWSEHLQGLCSVSFIALLQLQS